MSRELRIPADGASLSVVDYGGSGPAVVCLHGFGLNAASWNDVAGALQDRYRVVAVDQRGHGLTGPAYRYDPAALVDDVGRVVSSLQLDRPLLVGHSYGARTALAYASIETCSGVVAVDGAVTPPGTDSDAAALEGELRSSPLSNFAGSREELDSLLAGLDDEFSPDSACRLRQVIYRRFEDVDGMLKPVMTVPEAVEVARATEVRHDVRDLYAAVECPVLLVLASGDDCAGKEAALRDLPLSDDAVRWVGCGHLVPIEMPEELASLIGDFARAVGARGDPT